MNDAGELPGICARCRVDQDRRWISGYFLYCTHSRVVALTGSTDRWEILRDVDPGSAKIALQFALHNWRKKVERSGVRWAHMDELLQRDFLGAVTTEQDRETLRTWYASTQPDLATHRDPF
jgi:hypothetical protein